MGLSFGRQHPLPSEYHDLVYSPLRHTVWDFLTGPWTRLKVSELERLSENPARQHLADFDNRVIYQEHRTRFSRRALDDLYHYFVSSFPTLMITREQFISDNMVSHGGSEDLWTFAFGVIDLLDDGIIDFREFAIALDRSLNQSSSENASLAFQFISCGTESITRPSALAFFSACSQLDHLLPDSKTRDLDRHDGVAPGTGIDPTDRRSEVGDTDRDPDAAELEHISHPELRVERLFQLFAGPDARAIEHGAFVEAAMRRRFVSRLLTTSASVDDAEWRRERDVWRWELERRTAPWRSHST